MRLCPRTVLEFAEQGPASASFAAVVSHAHVQPLFLFLRRASRLTSADTGSCLQLRFFFFSLRCMKLTI